MQLRLNKEDHVFAVHFPAQKRTVLENSSLEFSETPVDGEPAILQMPNFAFIFDIFFSGGRITFDEASSLMIVGHDNDGYFHLGLGACIGHHRYRFKIKETKGMISKVINKFWFTRFYRPYGSQPATTLAINRAIQTKSRCSYRFSAVDGRRIGLFDERFEPTTIEELISYFKEINEK